MCLELLDSCEALDAMEKLAQGVVQESVQELAQGPVQGFIQASASVANVANASQGFEIKKEISEGLANSLANVASSSARPSSGQGYGGAGNRAEPVRALVGEQARELVAESREPVTEPREPVVEPREPVVEPPSEPSHEGLMVYGLDAEGEPVVRVSRASVLVTNQNTGRPLHCIHCGQWHQVAGHPWWSGQCDVCGERKGNKDRCSVLTAEWLEAQGYALAGG